ncbi:MAG: hypothetical protein KatS3mg105_0939 [Gemmatales bacterium]|nr:MAG: hypothetical protein KatS3mg105_0939 [Gemmatales bacterium]
MLCVAILGCKGSESSTLRLAIISPHRDEIREEVGHAFVDWFNERTQNHYRNICQAFESWKRQKDQRAKERCVSAFEKFWRDWRKEEVENLKQAFDHWRQTETSVAADHFLQEFSLWHENAPVPELVWIDIGGTSQILRYVRAQFQAKPQGIDIDLLFGGGTDIYLSLADDGFLSSVDVADSILKRIPQSLNGCPDLRRRQTLVWPDAE